MKPVKVVDLNNADNKSNKSNVVSVVDNQKTGEVMVPKTYSLSEQHIQQINEVAAELSRKAGKPVSSSVALRHLLDLAK